MNKKTNIYRIIIINLIICLILLSSTTAIPIAYNSTNEKLIELKKEIDKFQPTQKLDYDYWYQFKEAKKYWTGDIPIIEPPFNIELINLTPDKWWWTGDNFYEWNEGCIDYMERSFESGNWILNTAASGTGISGILGLLWGIYKVLNDDAGIGTTVSLVLGGTLTLISLFCLVWKGLWNVWTVKYINEGMKYQQDLINLGSVDIVVHVVNNQTGKGIDGCTIEAHSIDAKKELNNFDDKYWSPSEFNYTLGMDQNFIDDGWYTLKDRQPQGNIRWKKAVPPPGDWIVNLTKWDQEKYVGPLSSTRTIHNLDSQSTYCNLTFYLEPKIEQ